MGRKIPAKKHRGVKDPLVQQARRLQSLKGKINAPPKDPDEQPVPRSLTQLFAFQNKEENVKTKVKKNNDLQDVTMKTSARSNPIAKLKQLPGESGRGFSLRINSAIRALNEPTDHWDYQILQEEDCEDGKGARMEERRERRKRKRKKDADQQHEVGLSRVKRLALKKRERKKAREEASRPELVYERVSFGEVTHAPPALPAPRHGKTTDGAQRPVSKDRSTKTPITMLNDLQRNHPPVPVKRSKASQFPERNECRRETTDYRANRRENIT